MGSLKKNWPYLIALVVTLLNVDFVVIPFLIKTRVSGWLLFAIASGLSTIELAFWYWFWGWIIKTIIRAQKVRESLEFGKQIEDELIREGYFEKAKNFFVPKFYWAISKKNRIVRWVKAGGAISMVLIGVFPEPGTRTVGIIICRATRWKTGFYFLALGNILHLLYVIGGWKIFLS